MTASRKEIVMLTTMLVTKLRLAARTSTVLK